MRIAMIGQKGLPAVWGGVEAHVEELATRLAEQGHEVTAYCRRWYSPQSADDFRGVILRFVPSLHTKHFDTITYTLFATLDALAQPCDIIHYHGVGPALLAWIPRLLKPRAKVIVTFHSIDRRHGKWGLLAKMFLSLGEWMACKIPHETITISKTLKGYTDTTYNTRTNYLPNGFKKICAQRDESALTPFGLAKNSYILAVTRLVPCKGIHYLISAFIQLKKERPDLAGNLQLVIAGEGSYTDSYASYLRNMGLNRQDIVFTGWQTGGALASLFANAKLFSQPSQVEGMPIAALEAMSYGLPIVASDIAAHQEIFSDERFMFKTESVQSLKQALIWALENPEICQVNGLQNRRRAEREYNWETIAKETERLYKQTLNDGNIQPCFTVKKLGAQ